MASALKFWKNGAPKTSADGWSSTTGNLKFWKNGAPKARFYPSGVTYYGILKRWTGTEWVKANLKRYTGATWTSTTLKRWDGSQWLLVESDGV